MVFLLQNYTALQPACTCGPTSPGYRTTGILRTSLHTIIILTIMRRMEASVSKRSLLWPTNRCLPWNRRSAS